MLGNFQRKPHVLEKAGSRINQHNYVKLAQNSPKMRFFKYGRVIYRWKRILKLITEIEKLMSNFPFLPPFCPFYPQNDRKSTFFKYGRVIYRWKRILKLISEIEKFMSNLPFLLPFCPFLPQGFRIRVLGFQGFRVLGLGFQGFRVLGFQGFEKFLKSFTVLKSFSSFFSSFF